MAYKPKILAFAGSLRKDSYNKKLVKIAVNGARQAGADVTHIDICDYPLPLYDGDLEAEKGLPDKAIALKKLFWDHDGFLIASPEYNSSISGSLKNIIDWVSRPASSDEVYLSCFIDKVAVIMGASPGGLGGLRGLVHLRSILENIYTIVLPNQKTISSAMDAFDAAGQLKNAEQQQAVEQLGKKLTDTLAKLKEK